MMEIAILLLLLLFYLIWRNKPIKGVRVITPNELRFMLEDENKVFIDVRSPREFQARHISPFKNYPMGADLTLLPKDKEIVVLCQSGVRSKTVCKQLKQLGFPHVTDVKGGLVKY